MEHTKNQQLPKLLVVTGPQGSGNHLLAKIFNLHPKVNGWNMRWQEWQGHHLDKRQILFLLYMISLAFTFMLKIKSLIFQNTNNLFLKQKNISQ